MLVLVVLEHSEVASAEGFADFVVGHGVGSEVVYAEDSKARALVVISLKTCTQITLVLTNNRLVDYGWMVLLVHPLALPLSTVGEVIPVALMRSPANK